MAGPSSPTPYFSPSRSTDDGDDRPGVGSVGASPPPPVAAALQQPLLSPRFRHVHVGPVHHQAGGGGGTIDRPGSSEFPPHLQPSGGGGRQSPLLVLLDDRSVVNEPDVAHPLLLRRSSSSTDETDSPERRGGNLSHRAPLSPRPWVRSSGALSFPDQPSPRSCQIQQHHSNLLPQLSPRLPVPELRPRPSGSAIAAPLLPNVALSPYTGQHQYQYHHPSPRSPNPRLVNLSAHPPGYQGDDEGDCEGCDDDASSLGGDSDRGGPDDNNDPHQRVSSARSGRPLPARGGGPAALRRLAAALRRPGDHVRPSGLSPEESALWEALREAVTAPTPPHAGGGSDENRPNNGGRGIHQSDPGKPSVASDDASASLVVGFERSDAPSPTSVALAAASADPGEGEGRTLRALEAELTRRNRRIRDLEQSVALQQQQQQHQQDPAPQHPLTPLRALARSPGPPPPGPPRDDEARQDRSHPATRSPTHGDCGIVDIPGNADAHRQVPDDAMAAAARLDLLTTELREKTAALENAKMIIASLENANGSQLFDMRTKLKASEDELAAVKADLADRQRSLDSLATQLRDVQRSCSYDRYNRLRDEERSRRLGLSSRLEKNMTDFRAALVVLEATAVDQQAIEVISNLLSDTIVAMKDGIDMLDEDLEASEGSSGGWGEGSSVASAVSSSRGVAAFSDVKRLHKELDEKSRTMHRLEEALRRERDECARLRRERDESDARREKEMEDLRLEMEKLKEQCCTNMEVLTKKERELAVLRDSLKVDDGVGYISDDGTDATESDADEVPLSPVPHHLGIATHYGPSQAEALATLLAQSGGGSGGAKTVTSNEIQSLKTELLQSRTELERSRKQLKTEKESLVNAKMIISSLEKANKSIMDDLRSRLQESNTAITGLLEKSMEHDKTSSMLRKEIEALRQEKERYESELSKYRTNYLDGKPQMSLMLMDMRRVSPFESMTGTMDIPETID